MSAQIPGLVRLTNSGSDATAGTSISKPIENIDDALLKLRAEQAQFAADRLELDALAGELRGGFKPDKYLLAAKIRDSLPIQSLRLRAKLENVIGCEIWCSAEEFQARQSKNLPQHTPGKL